MGKSKWKGEVAVVARGEGAGGSVLQAGHRQGRAQAGHRQAMGSQSLGHGQRVSNTTGLIISLAWGCFKGCVHTEPR